MDERRAFLIGSAPSSPDVWETDVRVRFQSRRAGAGGPVAEEGDA